MNLEFELDYVDIEDKCILYRVKRKGLQVGTLSLDNDPYGRNNAKRQLLTMHDKIIRYDDFSVTRLLNALEVALDKNKDIDMDIRLELVEKAVENLR
jgi:hypothetical protein